MVAFSYTKYDYLLICIVVRQLSPEIILHLIEDYIKDFIIFGLSYFGLFYVLTIPKKSNSISIYSL
jgi:hypothetical protein